jgi:RimJ/RimL family protein N-acetyltransferase
MESSVVLPREIAFDDGVRPAAGPPPVPALAPPWSVRVVDPAGDADLIAAWMARPHVERFWEQAWPADRWAATLRAQLAGDYTRPCLVARDGQPLAYVEIYRTPRDVIALHYPADPHDLGIHLAIGPLEQTGRGVGRTLVRAIAASLFAADAQCLRVLADPDCAHRPARRMFAAAGFHLLHESDLGHKRAALLACTRPVASLRPPVA